jgi:hypothetical protein
MADAAAAFGLAAGILQFLDFGTRFAKKALQIYRREERHGRIAPASVYNRGPPMCRK